MQILKVIARLMDYPQAETRAHREGLATAITAAREISPDMRSALLTTLDQVYGVAQLDAEESYSLLFEQGRSMSLLLFEHVHGESRDRGQAMVDLMDVYQRQGFVIDQRELPDYIPLFLEFLSHQDAMEAREWLADVSHILARLGARLQERDSPYSHLFEALLMIAGQSDTLTEERQKISGEERDDTREAIDREWEEAAVTFSPPEDGACASNTGQTDSNASQPVHWVEAPNPTPQTNKEPNGGLLP